MEWIKFRRALSKYQAAARSRLDERVSSGDTDGTFGEYTMQEAFIDLLERTEKLEAEVKKLSEFLGTKE